MYQEMRTKDDAWMQSIHESIDQLSEILDSMPKDGITSQNDDEKTVLTPDTALR